MKNLAANQKKLTTLNSLQAYLKVLFQQTLIALKNENANINSLLADLSCVQGFFHHLEQVYQWRSPFFYGNPANKPQLHVYLADEMRLSGLNNQDLEQQLVQQWNTQDWLICAGKVANNFAQKHQLTPMLTYQQVNQLDLMKLEALIYQKYLDQEISAVIFYFNSTKLVHGHFYLLPINQAQFRNCLLNVQPIELKHHYLVPNLTKFVTNLEQIYVTKMLKNLVLETQFFALSSKLVKLDETLKMLDNEISATKRLIKRMGQNEKNNAIIIHANQQKPDEEW